MFHSLILAFLVISGIAQVASVNNQGEEPRATLGAYQVYKTRTELWVLVDVDSVSERGDYAEPPSTQKWLCSRVHRVNEDGAIYAWTIRQGLKFSANENFGFLDFKDGEVYLRSLDSSDALRLTVGGKPLRKPELKTVFQSPAGVNKSDVFVRTEVSIYGMGDEIEKLPENLASVSLTFERSKDGWGARRLVASSGGGTNEWRKTLIDLRSEENCCGDVVAVK